jgi:signal transduction histidine kinase
MLRRVKAMLRHSQAEARRSVWNLRNQILEQSGLVEALKELRQQPDGKATVEIRSSGISRRLPTEVEFHLLRIAQEAVANSLQHSGATVVELSLLFKEEAVTLSITDDGCGFDQAHVATGQGNHFGLLGMQERAEKIGGELFIDAASGRGTRITITVEKQSLLETAPALR